MDKVIADLFSRFHERKISFTHLISKLCLLRYEVLTFKHSGPVYTVRYGRTMDDGPPHAPPLLRTFGVKAGFCPQICTTIKEMIYKIPFPGSH